MKNNLQLKSKIISGLLWKFTERMGVQGINFAIQIILARLLFPKDYAIIALLAVFISVSNIFIQSGFNTALIQKKDADDLDFSSVFYFSLVVAIGLYAVLFFTAPFIADFYTEPLLVPVLRVQSIILLFGAFNSIQNAVLMRNMQFKKSFFVSVGGVASTGIVGVTMAYMGFGVWALVFSQITNSVVSTAILWITVAWRPRLKFSFSRLKVLLSFGWKLLVSALIDTLYNNLRVLIIGKLFDKNTLGYYDRGNQLPLLAVSSINGTISAVLFPALSSCQDDKVRLKALTRRSIVTSCFLVFPAMFGLAAVSGPLITILLTDKWIGCVPFMQLCALGYAVWPLHTANLQAINAVGRSDIFLKLEIIKKVLGVIVLLASVPFGVYAMVASGTVFSFLCTIINGWPNKKLLNYSFTEQWKDIMPSMLLSILMGIAVWCVTLLEINILILLVVQILIGVTLYLGTAWALKFESLNYLLKTLKELTAKNKNI